MTETLLLQIMNGYVAVTALVGAMIFLRYIWFNRHLGYRELRAALAILPVFIGVFVIYGPVFIIRTMANAGEYPYVPPMTVIILGTLLVELGFLCKIRVFSPSMWKRWTWVTAFLVSSIMVGLSLLWVVFSRR